MANVQLENGYIKIANALFEQLFIREFSILQLKILLLIIRCSYGFNKKLAIIKPHRLFEIAYIYRCDIKAELRNLQQNNVLHCNFDAGVFALNKNFDEWKIPFHKLFDAEKLTKLKKINFEAVKNVCLEQTEMFADNKQIEEEVVCPEQTSLPTTNKVVCAEQTEMFADNKQAQPENTSAASDTQPPKYNVNTYKDNNNTYICNTEEPKKEEPKKLDDPYLGKTQAAFCAEYQKVFKKSCYLNNKQRIALVEINADNPEFVSLLPVLISKFSKIRFDFEGKKQGVGLRWLLEEGNWSGVLSGDFDGFMEEETTKENDGWTIQ